jgi:tetratricopeptide (TPR) repeat protein
VAGDTLQAELIKQSVALAFTVGGKVAEYLWAKVTRRFGDDPVALEKAVQRLLEKNPEAARELRELIDAELSNDRAKPQIPVSSPHFVDRVATWQRMRGATGTAVLSGPPGIGKTALAQHFAQHTATSYPDGALLIDLADFRDGPGMPLGRNRIKAAVLARLGVELISASDESLAAQYVTVLAPKRLLLVFDNAEGVEDLHGLVPPAPMSLVLALTAGPVDDFVFEFAQQVPLGQLEPGSDRQLLEALCGIDLVQRDPQGAQDLLAHCDRFPAVLVAAAHLVRRREDLVALPLQAVAEELRGGGSLGKVSRGFDEVFAGLPADSAELCRLLTVFPGPSFTLEAATAIAGRPEVLSGLADLRAQVLVTVDPDNRLRLGNQARQAVRRAGDTSGTDDAFVRLVNFYRDWAVQADVEPRLWLYERNLPQDAAKAAFPGRPADWLAAELSALRALARPAFERGLHVQLTQICGALEIVALHRGFHRELLEIDEQGALAAEAMQDHALLARIISQRARLFSLMGEFERAAPEFARTEAALANVADPGTVVNRQLRASVSEFHGLFHREQGQFDESARWFGAALEISRGLGEPGRRGRGLHARMLANVLLRGGDSAKIRSLLAEADQCVEDGRHRDRAQVRLVEAKLLISEGRPQLAVDRLHEAWRLANAAGSNQYDLEIAETLGDAEWRAARPETARQHWLGVWQRYSAAGHPAQARLYRKLLYGLR